MIAWDEDVVVVARGLIGATLLVGDAGGTVIETEAYAPDDRASHSFGGPTARNAAMFGPPGTVYVYRSYGLHLCFNIVAGVRPGAAVLVRALAPTHGIEQMRKRRGGVPDALLCAGPGRLGQALGLTLEDNGRGVAAPPFALLPAPHPAEIVTGPRIGISRDRDRPWRFGLAGSRLVSRPFPR